MVIFLLIIRREIPKKDSKEIVRLSNHSKRLLLNTKISLG